MRISIGLMLMLVGIVLFIIGLKESESISSSFSKFFTNEPSGRSIFLMISGITSIVVGGAIGWRGSRT